MLTMKKLGLILLLSLAYLHSYSQCTVFSTNLYTVNLDVKPIALDVTQNGGGCTYRVLMQYSISFTGFNPPASMFTLQGNVRCNNTNIFFDLPNNGGAGTVWSSNASINGVNNCQNLNVNTLCDRVQIQIHGPGISNRTITCGFTPNPSPLPIELTSFEAIPSEKSVAINWTTASEKNNDFFEIQRSENAVDFETIGIVKGAGNSSFELNYSFEDQTPLNGTSYYRMKQTDYNGDTETFDIIAVEMRMKLEITSGVFPNPTTNSKIKVSIQHAQEDMITVRIYSLLGNLMDEQTFKNDNVNQFIQEIQLPESNQAVYLEITQGNEFIGRHLVVMK